MFDFSFCRLFIIGMMHFLDVVILHTVFCLLNIFCGLLLLLLSLTITRVLLSFFICHFIYIILAIYTILGSLLLQLLLLL